MSDDFLKERRQTLEEEFFHRQNQANVDAMREKLQSQNTREQLRRASGMEDEAVLDRMVEIGLTGETVAALSLVPLLHVAWADGKIQAEERDAILQGAEGKGIERNSPAWALLSNWLSTEPPAALFDAWKAYVGALGRELLTEAQFKVLRNQIVAFARGVAQAAGGFLGIGSVARKEDAAIARIEAAFSL